MARYNCDAVVQGSHVMKAFRTVLLALGLLLATTPHFFCPYVCGKADRVAVQDPACPHCTKHSSKPAPAPTRDCDSHCCDHLDATCPNPEAATSADAARYGISVVDATFPVSVSACTVIDRSDGPPGWLSSSPHAGRSLPLALGHLLL